MAFKNSKAFNDMTMFLNGMNESSASEFSDKFEDFVTTAPKIELDSKKRLHRLLERQKALISHCAVEIDGLSDEGRDRLEQTHKELSGLTVKEPVKRGVNHTYEALGTAKTQRYDGFKFELEVSV
jgi:hypothetical protein